MAMLHRRTWLALALGSSLALGCRSAMWQHSYRDDPLVLNRKVGPVPAEDAQPTLVARVEPEAPAAPPMALAGTPVPEHETAKEPLETADQPATPHGPPVSLIGTARAPAPVTPAVRSADSPVPAVPAAGQWAAGPYGHAPDYSWLQGVIDKHYRGHLELRFCDPSVEDRWGGKVCLEDDPRLHELKDGDVVLVLGEMVGGSPSPSAGAWNYYPHYHVRELMFVRHGS
jgi:hypothetical protein